MTMKISPIDIFSLYPYFNICWCREDFLRLLLLLHISNQLDFDPRRRAGVYFEKYIDICFSCNY